MISSPAVYDDILDLGDRTLLEKELLLELDLGGADHTVVGVLLRINIVRV